MRVVCTAAELSATEREYLELPQNAVYPISVGVLYVVFAVLHTRGRAWFTIAPDETYLVDVPSSLFRLTDARVSRLWHVDISAETLYVGPPELFERGFLERLIEGDAKSMATFNHIRAAIEDREQ